jgi:hypothetical protein
LFGSSRGGGTSLANVYEELEAVAGIESVLIAVFRNWLPFDKLHDEIRSAFLRRSAVQDLRDIRMIHHRQRLPLGFEAGDHLVRVHAGLDDLQSDAAASMDAGKCLELPKGVAPEYLIRPRQAIPQAAELESVRHRSLGAFERPARRTIQMK